MARIPGIGLDNQSETGGDRRHLHHTSDSGLEPGIRRVLEAQARKWGAPLANHLVYARRPTIFRGVRGMWGGIEGSGLIDAGLQALLNRRVAAINGCEF